MLSLIRSDFFQDSLFERLVLEGAFNGEGDLESSSIGEELRQPILDWVSPVFSLLRMFYLDDFWLDLKPSFGNRLLLSLPLNDMRASMDHTLSKLGIAK